MAEVYKAQDEVLGRVDAVKVLLPQFASDPTFAARFRQEAQAAANLNSPYIVGIYDWGLDGDTYYLVMEYIRGVDLKTAITQRGAIGQRKVAQIASQICSGLAVAHNNDVIHRDIKPQNIMIQPDGNIKIMDFGVARAGNSTMTQTGSVLGTANYVSPEQAQGKVPTAASDLYSLGVLMYEAVTGKLPFEGSDAISVALKQVQETPVPPSQINPDIDPGLEAIILKAMEKDPLARFESAEEMRNAINSYINGNPVNIGPVGAATQVLNNGGGTTTVLPVGAGGNTTAVMSPMNPQNQNANAKRADNGTGKKKKMSKGKKALLIIAIVAALGIIGGVVYATVGGPQTVPDLSGMTETEARNAITKAGYTIGDVTKDYSDTVAEGKVMKQDPGAKTVAEKNSKISIVISQGVKPPNKVVVPDLSGMSAEQAGSELKKLNLTSAAGDAVYDDNVDAGKVCKQSVAAGTSVDEGSTVTFYLSLGPEMISIPNVVNDGESSAKSELQNAGFTVKTTYSYSSTKESGIVISQSKTGTAAKGTTITIEVSQGPEPTKKQDSSSGSSGSSSSGSGSNSSDSNSSSGSNSSSSTNQNGNVSKNQFVAQALGQFKKFFTRGSSKWAALFQSLEDGLVGARRK